MQIVIRKSNGIIARVSVGSIAAENCSSGGWIAKGTSLIRSRTGAHWQKTDVNISSTGGGMGVGDRLQVY